MSGNTSLVSSTPGYVPGTYGARIVRNASVGTMVNAGGGLLSNGDHACTQRGAGANMSVDIGAGRAFVVPTASTYQGPYYCENLASYNTSSSGGYTWTAADGSNPRIDLVCIEVKDTNEDASGTTGWRYRIVDGTANAGATHQLETQYWPAVPSGCLPIAAIRVPAAATTLTTTNITNLNPSVQCGRMAYNTIATAETTTSASYARMTSSAGTADFCTVYVPHTSAIVRVLWKASWKISVASGTQNAAIFLGTPASAPVQLKATAGNGAPAVSEYAITSLGTFYSWLYTSPAFNTATLLMESVANATSDATEVTTGEIISSAPGSAATTWNWVPIQGLAVGWYTVEVKYKTSANTLSAKNRELRVEVLS